MIKKIQIGKKFNRLTFVCELKEHIDISGRKVRWGRWICDCGNEVEKNLIRVKNGYIKSCGCLADEIKSNMKHGLSRSNFYNRYYNIIYRCKNKGSKTHKHYGARGICCEWKTFEEFKNDMYDSYVEHCEKHGERNTTIERIDVNGNYCKDNCYWATYRVQSRNTTRNIYYKGKCLLDYCQENNLTYSTVINRIIKGYSVKEAIEKPVKKQKSHIYKGKSVGQWCRELGLKPTTVYMRLNTYGRGIERALGFIK